MPLVVACRKPGKITDEIWKQLLQELPRIVAGAFSVPGTEGELTATDIEIWAQDGGSFDVNTKDVEIVIWAHDYPRRKADLDKRRKEVVMGVLRMIPGDTHGFVWILLQPTSFGEF